MPPSDVHLNGDQRTPQLVQSPAHPPAGQQAFDLQASNSLNRSSPSDTARSDCGFSVSSNSPGEIVGTPFDIGSQRFEYPFPQTQGSPVEPFLPISSSITSASHANLPPWPVHASKSFPLTAPLPRVKAHPKLRNANAREPPVPPGLVKRRSRLSAGLQRQFSDEQSDKSDSSDGVQRGRRPARFSVSFTGADLQRNIQPLDTPSTRHSALRSSRSLEHPTAENQAGSNIDTGQAVTVNPPVMPMHSFSVWYTVNVIAMLTHCTWGYHLCQRAIYRAHEQSYAVGAYCVTIARQLLHWVTKLFGLLRS